jgi:hypothetical protein
MFAPAALSVQLSPLTGSWPHLEWLLRIAVRFFWEPRSAVSVEQGVKWKAPAEHVRKGNGTATNQKREAPTKAKAHVLIVLSLVTIPLFTTSLLD